MLELKNYIVLGRLSPFVVALIDRATKPERTAPLTKGSDLLPRGFV